MKTVLETGPSKFPVEMNDVKQHLNITLGWTEDDEVLATARFGPELQRDYKVEGSMAAQAEGDDDKVSGDAGRALKAW